MYLEVVCRGKPFTEETREIFARSGNSEDIQQPEAPVTDCCWDLILVDVICVLRLSGEIALGLRLR